MNDLNFEKLDRQIHGNIKNYSQHICQLIFLTRCSGEDSFDVKKKFIPAKRGEGRQYVNKCSLCFYPIVFEIPTGVLE